MFSFSILSISAFALLQRLFVLLAAYCCFLAIYRLKLHPLACYPGPALAKISGLYSIYHAWKGDRHLDFLRLHEQYGTVVRFGPNSLSFNSKAALSDIYRHDKGFKKTSFYKFFNVNKTIEHTHSTADKIIHGRKRRVLSQALSANSIKALDEKIFSQARIFCDTLHEGPQENDDLTQFESKTSNGWSSSKNMSHWTFQFTLDTISDLCFGYSPRTMVSPDNQFVIGLIENSSRKSLLCGLVPMIKTTKLDRYLYPPPPNSVGKSFLDYNKQILKERAKLDPNNTENDIMSFLLSAKDPQTGSSFTFSELWAESNLLVIAGSDTTAGVFSAALFYLVHNHDVLAELNREVRTTFEEADEIRPGNRLDSCKYLRACIDEAMRLAPPVPGIMPREAEYDGACVAGCPIPKGTEVGVPTYTIHHNPSYYPEPFKYNPSRWLVDQDDHLENEKLTLARAAFCPFSAGTRACLGKVVAYRELSVALAHIVFVYDIRLEPGSHLGEGSSADARWGRQRAEEYQLWDAYVSTKKGPMMQFRPRLS